MLPQYNSLASPNKSRKSVPLNPLLKERESVMYCLKRGQKMKTANAIVLANHAVSVCKHTRSYSTVLCYIY